MPRPATLTATRARAFTRLWPIYAALSVFAAAFVLPLVWMAAVSFKPAAEAGSSSLLPRQPTLQAYRSIIGLHSGASDDTQVARTSVDAGRFNYPLYARNTLLILVLSLAGVLISSSIAAYGFARIEFRGRGLLFGVCLATMMIPFPVLMVPTYMIFKQLGWIGTFLPLWAPAWFASAFNVFLLRQFYMGIPLELEESAMLDGCSRWGCFWRIMLPLSTPGLAVVALFHTLAVWNDLVGPLIYLSYQDQYTLALGLQFLQSRSGDTPWNELMAASTLIILPVVVLFLLAQRTFVEGVSATGIKG